MTNLLSNATAIADVLAAKNMLPFAFELATDYVQIGDGVVAIQPYSLDDETQKEAIGYYIEYGRSGAVFVIIDKDMNRARAFDASANRCVIESHCGHEIALNFTPKLRASFALTHEIQASICDPSFFADTDRYLIGNTIS